MMWLFYALLSAVFAALTSIFTKIGVSGVPSSLATAIKTGVVLLLAWLIVLVNRQGRLLSEISHKSWLFLILSGVATGFSWLFFNTALSQGKVTQVVSIDKLSIVFVLLFSLLFLQEPISLKGIIGSGLIVLGTILMIL